MNFLKKKLLKKSDFLSKKHTFFKQILKFFKIFINKSYL